MFPKDQSAIGFGSCWLTEDLSSLWNFVLPIVETFSQQNESIFSRNVFAFIPEFFARSLRYATFLKRSIGCESSFKIHDPCCRLNSNKIAFSDIRRTCNAESRSCRIYHDLGPLVAFFVIDYGEVWSNPSGPDQNHLTYLRSQSELRGLEWWTKFLPCRKEHSRSFFKHQWATQAEAASPLLVEVKGNFRSRKHSFRYTVRGSALPAWQNLHQTIAFVAVFPAKRFVTELVRVVRDIQTDYLVRPKSSRFGDQGLNIDFRLWFRTTEICLIL